MHIHRSPRYYELVKQHAEDEEDDDEEEEEA